MDNRSGRPKLLFFAIAITSVLIFLWRLFIPATEQNDPNSFIWMQFIGELIVPFALISLFATLRRAAPDDAALLGVTLAVALVASVGIIGMRLASEDGWYTGHRQYWPGRNP